MRKLNRPTDQRMAVMRKLGTDLLWYGKIETTLAKAKDLRSYAEKIITKAINTFEDVVKTTKTVVDAKGVKTEKEVVNDGPKKLAARRAIMNKVDSIPELKAEGETKREYKARTKNIKHPLIEKIFNEIAPKYAERKEQLGQGGGYTRKYLKGERRGDAAEVAIIELV